MQQTNTPVPQQYDDEIDLFELFQNLWQQKILILTTTLLAPVLAYIFTVAVPYKADYYQGSAIMELATIQIHAKQANQTIQVIESVSDLAQLVPNLTFVTANAPRGATKVLEISTSAATQAQVDDKLSQAVSIIEQRHQDMLKNLKDIQVITTTKQVGSNSITLKSPKDKLKLILAVTFVLGGMLGVFIALIRSAIRKRKLQTAAI